MSSAFQIKHFLFVEDLKIFVYLATLVGAIILLYGFYKHYRLWTYGGQKITIDNPRRRLNNLIVYGLLQKRVLREKTPGFMHLALYLGILFLLIATILRFIEADILILVFNKRILVGAVYAVYKLMANIGGILVIVGTLALLLRRLSKSRELLPSTLEDYILLVFFVWLGISGFILDGIATLEYRYPEINMWDPIGYLVASYIDSWSRETLVALYRALWILHMLTAIAGVTLIPYTKLGHIVFGGILNLFFARLEHPAAIHPVPDIEEKVDKGEPIGIEAPIHTTWKQRLDYDACVRCARCHNSCPANLSGKPLSPMNLVIDMKNIVASRSWSQAIVPTRIKPETIWSCVTCGACVYECPLLIHHVETITDIRRGLVARGENVPEELLQVSYNIMKTGNPYGSNPYEKEEWLKKLIEQNIVEEAVEGKEYDYLLWVGCAVAYDPRLRATLEALLRVLKKAGINIAVSLEQNCCGEPARRIGDELLFLEIVRQNKELFDNLKFKKLLVTCPHGYNVFKNEYPLYNTSIEVEHYTQLLARLVREGKLEIKPSRNTRVTYHDPCYLARWNNIINEPRLVLSRVADLVEMPRNSTRSFCCGGGGGGVFYDIKLGVRISKMRLEEARKTGSKTVVVACPFCNIMLYSDAAEYELDVKDLAELVEESLRDTQSS